MLDSQMFMFYDKYANILNGKRETVDEAVQRVLKIFNKKVGETIGFITDDEREMMIEYMRNFEVMPSMRLFSQSEAAIERDNSIIYNCSYFPIESIKDIATGLYLSMSGVGIGYSVEHEYIKQLPTVKPKYRFSKIYDYTIDDSQAGWADSIVFLLEKLFDGCDVEFDYSLIRPAGALLKTKTGIASGPKPLIEYHDHIRRIFKNVKTERKLTSLEVHDIVVKCVECGISGGGRRGAAIVFFDHDDQEMLTCKNPENIVGNEHRYGANNSAVWPEHGVSREFINRVTEPIWNSGTGEPGIFNVQAVRYGLPKRRKYSRHMRTNPCGEIILRPREFCNLTNIKLSEFDTKASIAEKVIIATLMGTIQSLFTDFSWISKDFTINGNEERLLGVSASGFYSNVELLEDGDFWEEMKQLSISMNRIYAERFGINQSAAITNVKPSGNSSVLAYMGAGVHPHISNEIIRNMMVNTETDMYHFLKRYNVPMVNHPTSETHVLVQFPIKYVGPTIKEVSALQHLNHWKILKTRFTEHNPSASIYFTSNEVDEIKEWLYDNQHLLIGLTFFPRFESNYPYLPIYAIDSETYERLESEFPVINWNEYPTYTHSKMKDERERIVECAAGECVLVY